MKSLIAKRSVIVKKRKTSITLEDDFWQALHEIPKLRRVSVTRLIGSIDAEREFANLSSAIRLFVLGFFKERQSRRYPTLGLGLGGWGIRGEPRPTPPLRTEGSKGWRDNTRLKLFSAGSVIPGRSREH